MRIRIEGSDLPGRRSGGEAHTLRLRGVHVGVQRTGPGRQVAIAGLIPVDAEAAVWAIEVTSREIDGLLDVGGPWVHGRPGARFLYLSWGVPGDSPGPAGPAGSAGPAGPGGPAGLGGPAGPAGPALPAGSVSPSGASAEGAAGDGAFGGG
ncbi:DUF5990 family protein, partial [Symbioplanes lichenis]|uniref:DUF5990 family protein n=1 Tax=Symbioplanes lichenis TaxID=1629072 RepID=UPI0027386E6C